MSTTILDNISLENILFLDIETVPAHPDWESLPELFRDLVNRKSKKYEYEKLLPEELYGLKAGIHAEFGKIICISAGYFAQSGELRVKSYFSDNERELLEHFADLLNRKFNSPHRHFLCAHNGIEFDFPYLGRRMMINGIKLPVLLNISGSKSWNNKWLIDTMDLWKFGDIKEKTSLALLAACFDIKSPKDDITGADVARVYYQEKDLERIRIYCQKDVVTLARLFQRFVCQPVVEDERVVVI